MRLIRCDVSQTFRADPLLSAESLTTLALGAPNELAHKEIERMKTARILHLEDDDRDAELIRTLLETQGVKCEVERVTHGAALAEALAAGAFDLILSDFSIPGFGGLQALELARKQCPDKPFVFISGTLGEEVAIDALKRGAADYVLKDRPARLGAAVTRALKDAEEARALKRAE